MTNYNERLDEILYEFALDIVVDNYSKERQAEAKASIVALTEKEIIGEDDFGDKNPFMWSDHHHDDNDEVGDYSSDEAYEEGVNIGADWGRHNLRELQRNKLKGATKLPTITKDLEEV